MKIHPRVVEKFKLEFLKHEVSSIPNLTPFQVIGILQCRYRSQLKLQLKKIYESDNVRTI